MQALVIISRSSAALAVPHATRATAASVCTALRFRGLFTQGHRGALGTNGVAPSMTLDASCNPHDAAVRAYSVGADTGATIPGRLHDQAHAKEDKYFRDEDVKQLARLTKIARAQARATSAELDVVELSELKKIVGDKVSADVMQKLIDWKHHH